MAQDGSNEGKSKLLEDIFGDDGRIILELIQGLGQAWEVQTLGERVL